METVDIDHMKYPLRYHNLIPQQKMIENPLAGISVQSAKAGVFLMN